MLDDAGTAMQQQLVALAGCGAMEVKTGKVIAWGQSTSFDPNTLDEINDFLNIGAQLPYEPGSTLKTFTYAAAINEGTRERIAAGEESMFRAFLEASNEQMAREYVAVSAEALRGRLPRLRRKDDGNSESP